VYRHRHTLDNKAANNDWQICEVAGKNFTYFDNEICLLSDENCLSAVVSHMLPTTTTIESTIYIKQQVVVATVWSFWQPKSFSALMAFHFDKEIC